MDGACIMYRKDGKCEQNFDQAPWRQHFKDLVYV